MKVEVISSPETTAIYFVEDLISLMSGKSSVQIDSLRDIQSLYEFGCENIRTFSITDNYTSCSIALLGQSDRYFTQRIVKGFLEINKKFNLKIESLGQALDPCSLGFRARCSSDQTTCGWVSKDVMKLVERNRQHMLTSQITITLAIPLIHRTLNEIGRTISLPAIGKFGIKGNFSFNCSITYESLEKQGVRTISLIMNEVEQNAEELTLSLMLGDIKISAEAFCSLKVGSSIKISLPDEFLATLCIGLQPIAEAHVTLSDGIAVAKIGRKIGEDV